MNDLKQKLGKLGFTLKEETENKIIFVKNDINLTIKFSETNYICYAKFHGKRLYLKTNAIEILLEQVMVLLNTYNEVIV